MTLHSDPCPPGRPEGMAKEEDIFPDAPEELTMDNAIDEMNAEQVLRSLALLLYWLYWYKGQP